MPRALGVGLAIVLAAPVVRADPDAPQINPIHLQREDAQRVHEQQRELDREPPPPAAPVEAARPERAQAPPDAGTDRTMRTAGVVLLGIAGLSALATVPFLDSPRGDSSGHPVVGVLLITAVVTGLGGGVLVASSVSHRSGVPATVQIAPTVTPSSVGLAIVGRL
jgi:hypothetical protein